MNYTSNITQVINILADKLEGLQNPDGMLREVALGIRGLIAVRVHRDGKDSQSTQIGTYSPGYMVVRTGNYQTAAKFVKGAKKGEFKPKKSTGDAGYRTKGNYTGAPRRVYNRTADTKVILSLTRQMENDLSVIAVPNGYGIGYKNTFNYQKSQWLETIYKKDIWKLTDQELKYAFQIAAEYIEQVLGSQGQAGEAAA